MKARPVPSTTVSLLVGNEQASKAGALQSITGNLRAVPKVRHDTMEGRDFVVVPMVMLTEGVHHGTDGPLYYPSQELAKTPAAWNHKPIVVYHPEINGVGVSACDPAIINARKVGVIMNTTFDGGKLKAEAWLEVNRANTVDVRVMDAVENLKMMEVSTGVFVDAQAEDGKWGDKEYHLIARNYRPDHLALLPDKVGACSIQDGAGFMRNVAPGKQSQVLRIVEAILAKAGVTSNELSFSNIREALSTALRQRHNVALNLDGPSLFVEDIYSDFVVYEYDGKLYRLGYESTDNAVTLSKEQPEEVKRVTEYRPLTGSFVANDGNMKGTINMDKQKIVDAIVKNERWAKTDPAVLMAMTDQQLEDITKAITPPAAPAAPVGNAAAAQAAAKAEPKTAPAPAATPATVEEYIAAAPRELQHVLQNSLAMYSEEKAKLVAELVSNKRNSFPKEALEARDLGELRALARLAGNPAKPALNYAGQAPVVEDEAEEPLAAPGMNFAKAN